MKKFPIYVLSAFVLLTVNACNKDNSTNDAKAKVAIHLTDAPGDYDAVYIDVQSVSLNTAAMVSVRSAPSR